MDQSIDFRSLVESHKEKVRNTCLRFVINPEDTDDVAQELFIQEYKSLLHICEEAELST